MNQKLPYQSIQISVVSLSAEDVIKTSGFNGDDDEFSVQNEI